MEIVQTTKLTEDEVRAMRHVAEIPCPQVQGCECDNCCLYVGGVCVRNNIRKILDSRHYAYEE